MNAPLTRDTRTVAWGDDAVVVLLDLQVLPDVERRVRCTTVGKVVTVSALVAHTPPRPT